MAKLEELKLKKMEEVFTNPVLVNLNHCWNRYTGLI